MRLLKLSSILFLLLCAVSLAFADVAEGEKLFKANCTSCHAINEKVVGPALKDAHKRRKEEWLLKWIKNSPEMVQSGDPIAVQLFNDNNKIPMLPFVSLKDSEIKSIIAYIKQESENPSKPVLAATAGGTDAGATVTTQPKSFYGTTTLIMLVSMALFLLVIVFVLINIKKTIQELYTVSFPDKAAAELKEQTTVFKRTWNYKLFKKHPVVGVSLIVTAFLIVLGLIGFDYGNKVVGVQTGYMPTQPINYSHQLHAGTYKINCQYCHSGADKSKQATVPSASTCMNCHMHVTASAKYNGKVSPEIQKIYDAVGWDGDKKMYDPTKKQTPIKWVRIHNLPDHAYFNHAQHVKIGKVECQACHGPIETMKVVSQQRSLQMGWCINCHREAKVDVANNDYYLKLHAELKKEGKASITVAQNGGTECGKCHY
jgi:cytochrome c551/c552